MSTYQLCEVCLDWVSAKSMKRHITHKHPHGDPFNSPPDLAAQNPSYLKEPGSIEVTESNSCDDDFRIPWDLEVPKEITHLNPEEEFRYEHLGNAGILLKFSVLTVRYASAGFYY
jgi:hypothetical protein